MGVLDLGGRSPRRAAGERAVVGGLAGVEPGPQVALLGAGQPGHGGRVAGVLLDQGQRLQHRVVQVGGDVGALLGADPLGALGGEVGGEPETHGPTTMASPATPSSAGDQRCRGPTPSWPVAQREDDAAR